MKKTIRYGALCCVLLLAFGCTPKSAGSNENLSQQVARHEAQLQKLLAQVGQVEQVLPGQAEMWSQMQTMHQELNSIQGRLEDLQIQLSGEGSGEIAQMRDKIARLEGIVRQIASQLGISTDGLDGGSYQQSAPSRPAPGYQPPVSDSGDTGARPSADTASKLYDAGVTAFSQSRYKDAILIFKDFNATFPKHTLAGNAHFWAGESYYQLKDYARAALAYQEVIANFPGSTKIQSSMLKQGMALFHAGKKEAARQRLKELISKYPSSPETTRAKDFMQKNKL